MDGSALRHMNLLRRDNFGSLFDTSASDASSGSSPFAGQSWLWTGNGPSPSAVADVHTVPLAGFDGRESWPSIGSGLIGQDMLWAGARSSAATWLADNVGAAGTAGLYNGNLLLSGGSMPSDGGSLLFDAMLFRFERISVVFNSSTLDSTLNQVLDLVWTMTGGTGAPPVTLPHAPTNPFPDAFPQVSLPSSQLVWVGEPPTHVSFPGVAGEPPITTPADNSLATHVIGHLAPQNLLWADAPQGVPASLHEQPSTGVTPNTLFGRS